MEGQVTSCRRLDPHTMALSGWVFFHFGPPLGLVVGRVVAVSTGLFSYGFKS